MANDFRQQSNTGYYQDHEFQQFVLFVSQVTGLREADVAHVLWVTKMAGRLTSA